MSFKVEQLPRYRTDQHDGRGVGEKKNQPTLARCASLPNSAKKLIKPP